MNNNYNLIHSELYSDSTFITNNYNYEFIIGNDNRKIHKC